MSKPHVILRTHSGVPVPPSWAKRYRVYRRRKPTNKTFNVDFGYLTRWAFRSDDIVAVEWLA